MALHLGDMAPNFQAMTTVGEVDFHEYLGNSWGILMSHPGDFTPVCTTEIGRTAQLQEEFAKRNTKVLVVSVDTVEEHHNWSKDICEIKDTNVDFPLIADENRKVAELYDMIHPNASTTMTVRCLFVIDPEKKIRLTMTYPAAIGRNFTEILRVVDALQMSTKHGVAAPADWKHGDDVIVMNTISTEEAEKKFPKGVKVVKPYLRFTAEPEEA